MSEAPLSTCLSFTHSITQGCNFFFILAYSSNMQLYRKLYKILTYSNFTDFTSNIVFLYCRLSRSVFCLFVILPVYVFVFAPIGSVSLISCDFHWYLLVQININKNISMGNHKCLFFFKGDENIFTLKRLTYKAYILK